MGTSRKRRPVRAVLREVVACARACATAGGAGYGARAAAPPPPPPREERPWDYDGAEAAFRASRPRGLIAAGPGDGEASQYLGPVPPRVTRVGRSFIAPDLAPQVPCCFFLLFVVCSVVATCVGPSCFRTLYLPTYSCYTAPPTTPRVDTARAYTHPHPHASS